MKIIESLSYTSIKKALSLDEFIREEKKEKNHRSTNSVVEWSKEEKKEKDHQKSMKGRNLDLEDWAKDEEREHSKK